MNKVEQIKQEKDGLAVWNDLDRFAKEGWESIPEADLERLKWIGVFHRKVTPGFFMMRVRCTHGCLTAEQAEMLAAIAHEFGRDALDLTTRQQVQLRWLQIENIPEVMRRLSLVGLSSIQTGMDSIRNVVGCPIAGIDPGEVFQTIPISRSITRAFLRNSDYTNLPRKFNIALSGCLRDCCHSSGHDIGMTPARASDGTLGLNVAVGGALGGSDPRFAVPLDVFVRPEQARDLSMAILDVYREHGPRESRQRARLKYLLDQWGIARFRDQVERKMGVALQEAGDSLVTGEGQDHLGIHPQKGEQVFYAGLHVLVGRIGARLMGEAARLARSYGSNEIRLTTQQNVVIPHLPQDRIKDFESDPVLKEMPLEPSPITRNLVVCTGSDHCHFALVETKDLAVRLAAQLEEMNAWSIPLRLHVSGCPHACGQHRMGDIGLQGARTKINGEIVPAADVFVGGSGGPTPTLGEEVASKVPWTDLPQILAGLAAGIGS